MIEYFGVTFDNVRALLCDMYFMREGVTEDEWRNCLQYVVPMQHNFENPIKPGSQNTWIQFWIDQDERHTQDYNQYDENITLKEAQITVRFLGEEAEVWAKAFHHLTKRKSVPTYFIERCNGRNLEYISPIVPINVDYFGVGNTTVAHDISFSLVYEEVMKLDWEPLEYVSIAPGEIK